MENRHFSRPGQLVHAVQVAVERGDVEIRVELGRRRDDVVLRLQAEQDAGVFGAADVQIAGRGRPTDDVAGRRRPQKCAALGLVVPRLDIGIVDLVAFDAAGHERDVGVVVAQRRARRRRAAQLARPLEPPRFQLQQVQPGAAHDAEILRVGFGSERGHAGAADLTGPQLRAGLRVERRDQARVGDAVQSIDVQIPGAGATAAGVDGNLGEPRALQSVAGGFVVGHQHAWQRGRRQTAAAWPPRPRGPASHEAFDTRTDLTAWAWKLNKNCYDAGPAACAPHKTV